MLERKPLGLDMRFLQGFGGVFAVQGLGQLVNRFGTDFGAAYPLRKHRQSADSLYIFVGGSSNYFWRPKTAAGTQYLGGGAFDRQQRDAGMGCQFSNQLNGCPAYKKESVEGPFFYFFRRQRGFDEGRLGSVSLSP